MTEHQQALDAALAQIDQAFGKGASEVRVQPATMTERVARELCRQHALKYAVSGDALAQHIEAGWENYVADAQSVFGAMCSPSEEMLDDAEGSQDRDEYQDLETAREQIVFIWQTMLTAAEYELDPDELARKARQAKRDQEWRDAGSPPMLGDEEAPF